MNRPILVLLSVALLAGGGIGTIEYRFAARQRAELRALRERNAIADRQLAELRQQGERLARDLRAAEDQVGQLPAVSVSLSAAEVARPDSAIAAWVARTRQLRDLLARRPEHAAPELQLLLDEDWLRIARDAEFETDVQQRRALAELRKQAKSRFVSRLVQAVQKFTTADFTRTPTDVNEIAPHFDPPIDAAILARYEIKSNPADAKSRARWVIRDRLPVDEEYDSRIRVESTGSHGSTGGPFAWNEELGEQIKRAQQKFSAERPGIRPANIADVIPYVQPPLSPATVERLLRLDRERQR
jgi:hypothetical protein